MTETGTEATVSLTKETRVVKPTLKALEYSLQTKISSRRATLGQLTAKKNELHDLMDDDANVEIIKKEFLAKYETLIKEFSKINADVKDIFCQIECVENMNTDQRDWFEPRNNEHREFVLEVNAWIQNAILRREEANKVNEQIQPKDSVSVTSKSRKPKSVSATSATSSARAERLKVELERAALLVKSATLRKRQTLEEQELQLKVEKEQLELHAGLAATDARLAVLRKYESSDVSSRTKGSRSDVSYSKRSVVSGGTGHSHTSERGADAIRAPVTSDNHTDNLVTVMQRQNDITESLIKQQRLSTLPSPNIPVFKGDPLEYRLFMRAFEHRIESKTENSKDRLYYLEQHTIGQPNDLVRGCFHMDSDQGYPEAKRLLKERFGDKYKISMAYLDKALNWPAIKADDTKALEAYALFMTNCNNAMSDLEYLEEMENAANMRTIISKLPYRLRERFRSVAIDIQKKQDRRTKFKDVVSFVNTQTEMAAHPVFGESLGQTKRQTERSSGKKNITTLAIEVKEKKVEKYAAGAGNKKAQEKGTNMDKAFKRPCIFCQGDHTMEQCKKLQRKLHKEKPEFLKSKGLCFSCLIGGHMSNACEEKQSCQICSATHPTLLHIKQKFKDLPKEEASYDEQKEESRKEEQTVVSGFVDAGEACSQTGVGGTGSVLAIVPVRVKGKEGQQSADLLCIHGSRE